MILLIIVVGFRLVVVVLEEKRMAIVGIITMTVYSNNWKR